MRTGSVYWGQCGRPGQHGPRRTRTIPGWDSRRSDMRVVGEAMVTPDLYRAVLKALSGRTLLVIRLAGVMFIVIGVFVMLTAASTDLIEGIGFLAIGLAFAVVLPWRSVRISIRRAAPALATPWRYEIDEDSIHITTPIASADWPWRNLRSVTEYPEVWLLGTPIKRQSV